MESSKNPTVNIGKTLAALKKTPLKIRNKSREHLSPFLFNLVLDALTES